MSKRSMGRTRLTQAIAVVAGLVSLTLAAWLAGPVAQEREDLQLVLTGELDKSMPPQVRLATAALGSFRGLAANILWYRLTKLKEQGKYYEANTLADLITTLQPQFAQVWAFHAWNMAYNISVTTYTPDERYDWVSKGIDLLRNKAVKYNPNSPRIYRELSWIFFHKIGGQTDDMHWIYKARLAYRWQQLLGGQTPGLTTDETIDEFRVIPESPDTLSELRANNPRVDELVDAIRAIGYSVVEESTKDPDEELLRTLGQFEMFYGSIDAQIIGMKVNVEGKQAQLHELYRNERYREAFPKLIAFLRKHVLIEHYHMDPDLMLDLMEWDGTEEDEGWGPLDWRHPSSHGLYWAYRGTQIAKERRSKKNIDAINMYRQAIHSMQDLMHYGRVSFDPANRNNIDLSPDPRFIYAYDRMYERARRELKDSEFTNRNIDSFNNGHENFLLNSMMLEYLYGETDKSRDLYDRARSLYANAPHNKRSGRYLKPFDDLIMQMMEENLSLNYNTNAFIDATLERAFSQGYAENRPDVAERFLELAKRMHRKHQGERAGKGDKYNLGQSRMGLGPFRELLIARFGDLMRNPQNSPMAKARIWQSVPLDSGLKQATYEEVYPVLAQQAQAFGLDPQRAFPVPPGMEMIRERLEAEAQQRAPQGTDNANAAVERQ